MNEEEKLIKEQWDKLSPELQKAIESIPWRNLIKEISQTNTLDAEQVAVLERETMFILYGLENPNDFIANITREVGISEEQALKIAEVVVEKIFEPILAKVEGAASKVTTALPMVEEGERAHDVPHVETAARPEAPPPATPVRPEPKVQTPLPDYRYPEGSDPYREPLK